MAIEVCMLLWMSVLATVLRMLSFLFAAEVIFWMCLEKVRCVSNVRPRIFEVLLKGMGVLFSRTCGWVLDMCLSVVEGYRGFVWGCRHPVFYQPSLELC